LIDLDNAPVWHRRKGRFAIGARVEVVVKLRNPFALKQCRPTIGEPEGISSADAHGMGFGLTLEGVAIDALEPVARRHCPAGLGRMGSGW
jgi:hypothetical protein